MEAWRWNGDAFEPAGAIPLEDRGFRYGMAIFESIRLRAGKPLFLDAHLQRLRQATADRAFAVTPAALAEAGRHLQEMRADGFARIYVTAGPGTVDSAAEPCGVYILFEDRRWERPTDFTLVLGREAYQPIFGGMKTACYWGNVHQLQKARSRGAKEALLFNPAGELVSACMANVFLVHGEEILTPALACGARKGVVREWALGKSRTEERVLRVEDVENADEIFLTNSWIGIVPASAVDGRPLPSPRIGSALAERYEAAIQES